MIWNGEPRYLAAFNYVVKSGLSQNSVDCEEIKTRF